MLICRNEKVRGSRKVGNPWSALRKGDITFSLIA